MNLTTLRIAASYLASQGQRDWKSIRSLMVAAVLKDAGLMEASALHDVSKLRYQAVFLMGAGGSGKGFVGQRWMKYMPGGDGTLPPDVLQKKQKEKLTEAERGFSNLNFQKAMEQLAKSGVKVELVGDGKASIPFRLYSYDSSGAQQEIPPGEWDQRLPPAILEKVRGLKDVIFTTPVHELPSYWRQVNPDVYKEELEGYLETEPGYVHEMSSEMSKAYFVAAVETGDPLFVDGTGANARKMVEQIKYAQNAGYRVSLVYVRVPLVVNQIRNALRSRNVDPDIVTRMWYAIDKSFHDIKPSADKAKVINNLNDAKDEAGYLANKEKVDAFIRHKTEHPDLASYIEANAPGDMRDWGDVLRGKADRTDPAKLERQQKIDKFRQTHR